MDDILRNPSPEALGLAMEANWCASRRALQGAVGVQLRDDDQFFWFTSAAPVGWFNAILRATLTSDSADDDIRATLAHFRAHGTPWIWITGPGSAPEDLPDRLARHGFTTDGSVRGMAMTLPDAPIEIPALPDVEIVLAKDDSFALWQRVVLQDDEGDTIVTPLVQQLVMHSAVAEDRWHFVALLAGEPVGTATVTLAAGVAGLYGVRTLPHARNRGIGNALTLAALRYAQDHGYTIATLQASRMGFSIYHRLGFRVTQRFPVFTPSAES